MELIGIFIVASGLLVLAGVAKAGQPEDTARALVLLLADRTTRVPPLARVRHIVRIGASLEAILGVAALLFPRPVTAALVAASYGLFVCIVVYARRRGGPLSTCGCFGRPDTPATGFHLLLNVVFVAAAVAVTVRSPNVTSLVALLAHQPWHGVPLVFAGAVGVLLSYLALSPLAALEGARRLIDGPTRNVLTK